ncbi:CG8539 [Drosophila busckii]|uniref:CG8539 n=1 Tax=Drosophila busckii TaxID=30019 RepID=A0A0M3QW06_DROBS|nr:carboxypeptidase B [Drosophila busckii]ALC43313.1 CG8539 [Drosophila busckii]
MQLKLTTAMLCISLWQVAAAAVAPQLKLDEYYSYEGMRDYLAELARVYGERVTLRSAGLSHEQRMLQTITISNGDGRKDKPVIFMIAAEHAREWLTPVAALYAIEQLVVNFEQNAQLLLDHDWLIMPLTNPDGYTYSREVNARWRNTRSPNGNGCYGTNLNRNYDIAWGKAEGYPELQDPCSEHYAGASPFSEAESRAVRDIMLELQLTEREFMFLTLHSRHQSFFYPWTYKTELAPNAALLKKVATYAVDALHAATGCNYTEEQPSVNADPFGGTSMDYAQELGFKLSYTFELTGWSGKEYVDFWPPTRLLKQLAAESWIGIRALAEGAEKFVPAQSDSLVKIFKILLLLVSMTLFSS